MISNLFGSQKFGDFYPTPQKCLETFSKDLAQFVHTDEHILEPTAGIGSIVHFLTKKGYYNIEANEINKQLHKYLKNTYFNQTITNKNFLETDYKNNKFSLVFCNPPFTNGGDKRYYFDFFFKCCEVLSNSSVKGPKLLYFISLKLSNDEKEDNLINEKILSFIPKDKLTKLFKKHIGRTPSKQLIKDVIEGEETQDTQDLDALLPYSTYLVGSCTGFAGTGTKAFLYKSQFF